MREYKYFILNVGVCYHTRKTRLFSAELGYQEFGKLLVFSKKKKRLRWLKGSTEKDAEKTIGRDYDVNCDIVLQ